MDERDEYTADDLDIVEFDDEFSRERLKTTELVYSVVVNR